MNQPADPVGKENDLQKWWGEFEIPENQWCCWRVSLLHLFARRAENEWHFAWVRGDDPLDASSAHSIPGLTEPDLESATQSRHVMTGTDNRLILGVMLADRPVIARPEVPLFVPAGERVVLYVSTTLWLRPIVGGQTAFELPVQRPSDTWFGLNTRIGELCYASVTRARTSEKEAVAYPHRAVTPIDVINQGTDALPIERLRVPVTLLSLYVTQTGQFVTDRISLKRRESEEQATMEISAQAEDTDSTLIRLAEPREQSEPGAIVQAFTRLFG